MDRTSEELAVDVNDLHRRFGSVDALRGVDLEVRMGEVFGLVGVNGSGKTTLIQHVVGSLRAKRGRVRVLGRDPTVAPEKTLSRIGVVTEESSLPDWLSAIDLRRYGRSIFPQWDDAYADELLRRFEIDQHRRLALLSRGGRARVAIAMAIAQRPDLLVLDEPSAGLDPIGRRDVLEMVVTVLSGRGIPVVFSTHHLDQVQRLCDRVAVMREGKLSDAIEVESIGQRWVRRTVVSDPASPDDARVDPPTEAVVIEPAGSAPSEDSSGGREIGRSPATVEDWFAAMQTVDWGRDEFADRGVA